MVTEVIHVQQVKLSPGVVVTLIVPFSREIQPLGVAKLIPCDIKNKSVSQIKYQHIAFYDVSRVLCDSKNKTGIID